MDHNKNSPVDRKASYIPPLIIAGVLAVIVAAIVIRPAPRETPQTPPAAAPAPPKAAAEPVPAQAPPVPVPTAPLERADLIAYAQRAASQFAANGTLPAPPTPPIIGRRFSLRLPFGCNGPNNAAFNPQASVTYDAEQKSLTATAQPGMWDSLPVMRPLLDAGQVEAVEGFWLPRSWTMSEDCPPASTAPAPAIATPATAQTLGLAQLFAPGTDRTKRHNERPYTITRKLGANDFDILTHSYRLVLEGTVTGYPGGDALRCWTEGADHQPICIFAVTLDHVALADFASGDVLANWPD